MLPDPDFERLCPVLRKWTTDPVPDSDVLTIHRRGDAHVGSVVDASERGADLRYLAAIRDQCDDEPVRPL